MLVTFDRDYCLRDLYFPHVGQENHTAGRRCRFGVWVDGEFAWLEGDDWRREVGYEHETLVTRVMAESERLGLRLRCGDAVDFDRNVYLKRVLIDNLSDHPRQVRLYFHFDCHLSGINVGDTAYFEPAHRALVHYKGRRYFWLCGQAGEQLGLSSYAAGKKDLPGLHGTWMDAEDGHLGGDPITQGSVDSVGALHLEVPAGGTSTAYWWLAAGKSLEEVQALHAEVAARGPAAHFNRTADYWRLWLAKSLPDFADLPPRVVEQYKRSLLILRTQVDDGGAVIAANDSDILQFGRDTYSYMWPRDGAFVSYALTQAGHQVTSRRFFEFCASSLSEKGYLLHKYNPGGSLGSSWHPWANSEGEPHLPIQEDETALVLWALWEHYAQFHDLEFIKQVYDPLVTRAGIFLARYRDAKTGLPAPSYDLWEERYGIWSFTCVAVWAGLHAAAHFTDAFGDDRLTTEFRRAAAEIRFATLAHLWDVGQKRFLRGLRCEGKRRVRDATVDSSLAALGMFRMLPPDDPRLVATLEAVETTLWCSTPIGGVARYEGDPYQRAAGGVPGNPWILCTLWLAHWLAMIANRPEDLTATHALIEWALDRALPSGVLAEQVHPHTGEPLSVSPLTWSHAALITTVHHYLDRHQRLHPRGEGERVLALSY